MYLTVAVVLMAGPAVGMLWYEADTTVQTSELASWPEFVDPKNGSLNAEFLLQTGTWFDDHFAYRPETLTLHARLQTTLLGVSPTDRVVYGTNGWLYYAGTLNDYLATETPPARRLFNEAHNLRLMQDYVEATGAQFAVTVAPNKNSVYGEQMPWWYNAGNSGSGQVFAQALAAAGVTYINLFDLYGSDAPTRANAPYFQRDSHWTNAGAELAYERIMQALGREEAMVDLTAPVEVRIDHRGDIEALLFPTAVVPEADTYRALPAWAWFSEDEEVGASLSATVCPTAEGTLLMYRDSFGNALIPYFSASFGTAHYVKLTPYDLTRVEAAKPEVVLVEIAERNVINFATTPPALPGPLVSAREAAPLTSATDVAHTGTFAWKEDGPYTLLSGSIPASLTSDNTQVFVQVVSSSNNSSSSNSSSSGPSEFREAFCTSFARNPKNLDEGYSDWGYKIYLPYLPEELNGSVVNVIITTTNGNYLIATNDTWECEP